MYNFKPVNENVGLTKGNMRIVDWGNVYLSTDSSTGYRAEVELPDVALAPNFDKNLFSLMSVVRHGFTSRVTPIGTSMFNGTLFFRLLGNLNVARAISLPPPNTASATFTPGIAPCKTCDINNFHCGFGHMHEPLLHDTAR